jgi:tellurite resistance protein TerA
MQLRQGEKRSLPELGIGQRLSVRVDFGLDGVDIAAFGLNAGKRIGDDRYVVLFSNPRSPDGAISLRGSPRSTAFDLDLALLPSSIDCVVFTATHDVRPIAEARPLIVSLDDGKAVFDVAEHLTGEKAVMMIEVYRHATGWKVGTIAAGFAGGLASLITHFGGEVEAQPSGSSPSAGGTPAEADAPVPSPVVSLRKVTLQKSNPSVSLRKTDAGFGEIVLNLNWNAGGVKRGIFGGGAKSVDLDLGVLFELQDGYRGCIQALGGDFGNFDEEPWIRLSGDDRTGAVAAGETIRVNGRFFDRIKRIGVFALIYDGAPNWSQTDGLIRMSVPGQPDVEVRMDEGQDSRRLCGVAVIDNVAGELRMNRHMRYYRDQKGFADDIGVILRWTAGTKD